MSLNDEGTGRYISQIHEGTTVGYIFYIAMERLADLFHRTIKEKTHANI